MYCARYAAFGRSPRRPTICLGTFCLQAGRQKLAADSPILTKGPSKLRSASSVSRCLPPVTKKKLKRCRIHIISCSITISLRILKLFCKEAVVWKHLVHPNIVPFKGLTLDPFQLVSEWMPNGELRHYVKNNPDIDLLSLVGIFYRLQRHPHPSPQILGIAQGLAYLHSKGMVHGDLKGVRILLFLARHD